MKSSASILLAAAAMLAAAAAGAQTAPAAPAMPGNQPAVPAVPATPVMRPLPASQWTMPQVRQSFELADSDSNGQLTRAEAQQLTIMPRSFEEFDANKDGFIGRGEYESVFTR